jgi:dolichol-phosphate mannosyltransferase
MGAQAPIEHVAALVPCHRAPPSEALLRQIAARVDELLVVDDGMAGLNGAVLERFARRAGAVVLHTPHGGKGHAIVQGLRELDARGRRRLAVVILDSDGQHPPDSIPDLLDAAAEADLVIGNRFTTPAPVPPIRRLANAIASSVLSRSAHASVPDSQCGMRVLCRRALTEIPFPEGGYEAETVHLRRCLRAGVPVAWVPIPAVYNGSPSSFRPLRDSAVVLAACVRDPARRSTWRPSRSG